MSKFDSILSSLRAVIPPIHPEGWPFIAIFAVVTVILGLLYAPLFFIGLVLTGWCILFFRDPARVTPTQPGLVVSPADGVVQSIIQAPPPAELEMGSQPLTRIAVFMNVFNVHVNRTPVDGQIVKMAYRAGKFLNADLDKASEDNERQSYRIMIGDGKDEREIAVVQIAGLIARRIVTQVTEGDSLKAGQRIGMIRFGSRVDVFLPRGVVPQVCVGQAMIAGETVLAEISGLAPKGRRAQRQGEIR